MAYTLYAAGLACFIEQSDKSFVVALPDGRKAKHPVTGKPLDPHEAYLIVMAATVTTENWPGELRDGMAFLPIEPGVLTLPQPDGTGTIDTSQYRKHKVSWAAIDANFQLSDKKNPKGSLATAAIRHGTLRMYKLSATAEALVVQIDIPFKDPKDNFATIELETLGKKVRRVTFPADSEIVLANVSRDRLAGGSAKDDVDHFYIYYVLNVGGKSPSGKLPDADPNATPVLSRHEFLKPDRDLSVSCTPTNQP